MPETVRCPEHPENMTAAEAMTLALALMALIDEAEGHPGRQKMLTRGDVLDELAAVRASLDHYETLIP